MLRNLVVPAAFIVTALMTGCQTTLDNNYKPSTPVVWNQDQPESKTPPATKTTVEPIPTKHPENIITIKEQIIQTPIHRNGRLILGLEEGVELPDLNLQMTAKLDTGASNSSVDARNIQLFERDSKKWVKFNLYRTSKGTVPLELPLKTTIKIKRPGLKAIERPVVSMTIVIGELTQQVMVTLTDREKYQYPLLIGRNFIQDLAIIDVNKKNIAKKSLVESRLVKVVASKGKKSFTKTINKPVSVDGLKTLGAIEPITFPDSNITLKARIDTGAKTSSLDARDMEIFQKNKKDWVRFNIPYQGKIKTMEQPITRFLLIKRHDQESERRPVITINTKIGELVQPAQFSLRNREGYKYPVLIGERFLKDAAIVDVSQKYTSGAAQRGHE
ncbi:hypothetical protein ACH42_06410 [Endozoicomonas sp. (ex Bugula neritina AB1)]|nr:hypothetical protein ACH42_06410 [Endozoicomonas sp. (ex Bugula neritina AB1)]